jgi:hypothetical protein
MITVDPNLIFKLQKEALWLVIHPCVEFDKEIHQIYPWLAGETVNFSRKIYHYLQPINHKARAVPEYRQGIYYFDHWPNLNSEQLIKDYMNKNSLTQIVYCGFHYGYCITSDPDIGMSLMSKHFECFCKQDLSAIAWETLWDTADAETLKYGKII